MQFQYNSDHPALSPETGEPVPVDARGPTEFPPAQPVPCARITTRIFHPARNQVATVQNVLVRTQPQPALLMQQQQQQQQRRPSGDGMNDSLSSSSDDLSSMSDASMGMDNDGPQPHGGLGPAGVGGGSTGAGPIQFQQPLEEDRAYWVQRTIREAIYGKVMFAVILKRRKPTMAPNDTADWEVTDRHCAVKEMSWQHIRRERSRLAEDPIKEVAAMQYLRRWHMMNDAKRKSQQQNPNNDNNGVVATAEVVMIDGVAESFRALMETNIMMPLDLLSDDRNMYSVMPYCDGGELFERLDLNEKFSEPEARYWMHQVLNVSCTHSFVCKRSS